MKSTGVFLETAPCFCVRKDAPLLHVVNRMHNTLLIRYRKTNMAEYQRLFSLALSSTSEVITTFSLFKQKNQLNLQDDYEICRGYYTVRRRYEFYVRVTRTISHSFTALTREMLSRQAPDPGQWLVIEPG